MFGLGCDVGKGHRHRMRTRVAPLEPCAVVWVLGVRMIGVIGRVVAGCDVRVRRQSVMMFRVIVVRIRVDVLQRGQPGDRQYGYGDDGGDTPEHWQESTGTGRLRQTGRWSVSMNHGRGRRSNTTLPPKTVVTTARSAGVAGGVEKTFVASTTKSASLPGASDPLIASSNPT